MGKTGQTDFLSSFTTAAAWAFNIRHSATCQKNNTYEQLAWRVSWQECLAGHFTEDLLPGGLIANRGHTGQGNKIVEKTMELIQDQAC